MEYYKTIEVQEYDKMLEEISKSKYIDLENFDLLIYCSGGHSKKYYRDLKNNQKYEVLWSGWGGAKWTKIFSFAPGQAGLVKIINQAAFKEIYYELATTSVSDAIYIPKFLTSLIINEARERTCSAKFENFLMNKSDSFVLVSETDQSYLKNGKEYYLYDYFFSSEMNQKLKDILARKK